jgi:UDP-glucose 4-epimerase
VFDFCKQLLAHPDHLRVLGDGRQKKSYLYIQDCVSAILQAVNSAENPVTTLNLGTDEYCEVNDSIRWISECLGLRPHLEYTGGDRGWIGDNPFIFLDCKKVRSLGWEPRLSIQEAIGKTVQYLMDNRWLLDDRPD